MDALGFFHPVTKEWFKDCFEAATEAQAKAWPAIARGESTLLMAPTGSGKTLAAFLYALDRLAFADEKRPPGCRVLYISPIKALAVDVERNLRAPLSGLRVVGQRMGVSVVEPRVAIRSGDTPARERQRMRRHPPDILITTPESLYLLLTSRAREILRTVDTVIIDEIHALVASKRGSHLFLSLERLEALRQGERPLQRIGLSATQRPLGEVARLLGGYHGRAEKRRARDVTIVDAATRKQLSLHIEVPTSDMVHFSDLDPVADGEQLAMEGIGSDGRIRSIWPAVYPKLVAHIRAQRSTIVFVNARRTAERLANALNEVAGEEIARAHHGSLALGARREIEDLLKQGKLPAIVATASLELGIDMGAVELVVQIEAPPSIASGLQRVGRAQHHVGGIPKGITYPKFRSDLVACAAAARAMLDGAIEATRYPRNPLDVLAQQLVAMVAMDDWTAEELYETVIDAAPFAELTRGLFDSVLDMLSGRYPSDEFSDLRPRITWDRLGGGLQARKGAQRIAVINGGTIPDRGLYGVFLATEDGARSRRVGELDEEMVFESRVGEVFLLGASSWRVEDIGHDRVLVSPAPGEPGKMPFWHGDRPGRPLEFGRAVGAFVRRIAAMQEAEAMEVLQRDYTLDENAAINLVRYLREQQQEGALPNDRCVVLERFLDEVGDWRICILSPFGSRVHAPWAMAVRAKLLEQHDLELDVMWSDDGMVFRVPDGDRLPDDALFFPEPEELEERILSRLAETSLFAARFRENAGRSLLLPKRRPGGRSPLWALRRRAASLLSVASRYRDFPVVLETYRECLQDRFDVPGLCHLLADIHARKISVRSLEEDRPSPFAAALMFQYVANFMYQGDAPLAERRAQALTVDPVRLRELLGEAALRELLDVAAIDTLEQQLQFNERLLQGVDAIHDLLLAMGPLREEAIEQRCAKESPWRSWLERLLHQRRIVRVRIGGHSHYAAAEDSARLRDGLGVVTPPGLPLAFLEAVEDPLGDLVLRFARRRGPFTSQALALHYGLAPAVVDEVLQRLERNGRLISGEFLPGGSGQEWCHLDVLRRLKRMSLAKLRSEVESVGHEVFARFAVDWHGLMNQRRGSEGVLDAVERLQGAPLPASVFESQILSARVRAYGPALLDELCAAGEVVWLGLRASGHRDGRLALYLSSHLDALAPASKPLEGEHYDAIRDALARGGAQFFQQLKTEVGGFPDTLLERLWDLVWNSEVSNDSLAPLRSFVAGPVRSNKGRPRRRRGMRQGPKRIPGSEGRWWLVMQRRRQTPNQVERQMALAEQLLERHGVFTREAVHAEALVGGYRSVYPVFKALEEAGRVRRGYFVAGLGATQFAVPGADDLLRDHRQLAAEPQAVLLASTDPANPFGAALPWPEGLGGRPQRSVGSQVLLVDGSAVGYLSKSGKALHTHLSEEPQSRRRQLGGLVQALAARVKAAGPRVVFLETIDSSAAKDWPFAGALVAKGFRPSSTGLLLRYEVGTEAAGA
jgi:ATP-dependent helicase Lhr and Lhr-like helicase